MRTFMLFIFSIIPVELLAQETKDNFADSIIVCQSKQALGLPAMDRYIRGYKYIQELPSQAEYVLKPLKKVIDLAELTNDEIGGFLTHKYTSKGSITRFNEDETGVCWADKLEDPFAISCNNLIKDSTPTLEEIENSDLRSKVKIDQTKSFMQRLFFYEELKIAEGRFIAKNKFFRDCDNPFCARKQDVLLERGTCSVY